MRTILLTLTALLTACGTGPDFYPDYDAGDTDTASDSDTDVDGDTDTTDTETSTEDTGSDTDTGSETETVSDTDTGSDTTDTDTGTACPADVASLDETTGLCWQVAYDEGVTKAGAESYCDALNLGGFTDWRLPTRSEYLAILSDCGTDVLGGYNGYCNSCATSPVCYDLIGTYGNVGCYWMSDYVSPGVGWGVCLDTGWIASGPDNNSAGYARCVRTDE